MAFAFPETPTAGQTVLGPNGATYKWDEVDGKWYSVPVAGGSVDGDFVQISGDEMTGKLTVPVMQVGPDDDNQQRAIINWRERNTLGQDQTLEFKSTNTDEDIEFDWVLEPGAEVPQIDPSGPLSLTSYGGGLYTAVSQDWDRDPDILVSADGKVWSTLLVGRFSDIEAFDYRNKPSVYRKVGNVWFYVTEVSGSSGKFATSLDGFDYRNPVYASTTDKIRFPVCDVVLSKDGKGYLLFGWAYNRSSYSRYWSWVYYDAETNTLNNGDQVPITGSDCGVYPMRSFGDSRRFVNCAIQTHKDKYWGIRGSYRYSNEDVYASIYTDSAHLVYSDDAITWTEYDITDQVAVKDGNGGYYKATIKGWWELPGGSMFLQTYTETSVGEGEYRFYKSFDFVNWQQVPHPADVCFNDVQVSGRTIIAYEEQDRSGYNETVAYASNDLSTWELLSFPEMYSGVYRVIGGNLRFVFYDLREKGNTVWTFTVYATDAANRIYDTGLYLNEDKLTTEAAFRPIAANSLLNTQKINNLSEEQATQNQDIDDLQENDGLQDQRLDDLEAGTGTEGNYYTKPEIDQQQGAQDSEINKLQGKVEELEVNKGTVAKYKVKGTSFGVATRDGELYVNNTAGSSVTSISIANFTLVGDNTKPVQEDDILELHKGADIVRYNAKGSDIAALPVEYVGGALNFAVDDEIDLYVYPANSAGIDTDYVDQQDDLRVLKAGDAMTGSLSMDDGSFIVFNSDDNSSRLLFNDKDGNPTLGLYATGLVETTSRYRTVSDVGNAFEVTSTDTSTKAYIDSAGNASFVRGEFSGNVVLESADDSHRFYVKDQYGDVNTTIFPSGQIDTNGAVKVTLNSGNALRVMNTDGTEPFYVSADGGANFAGDVTYQGITTEAKNVQTLESVQALIAEVDISDQLVGINEQIEDIEEQLTDKISKGGDTTTGDYDFDGDCLIRVNGDVVIKDKSQSIGGANLIGVYQDQQRVQYWGKVDEDNCVATKEYVDDAVGDTANGIEDVGTSAPPAERPRGSVVLSNDKLFYYV